MAMPCLSNKIYLLKNLALIIGGVIFLFITPIHTLAAFDGPVVNINFPDNTTNTPPIINPPQNNSNKLIVSEIMPDPVDGVNNEFIELFNSDSVPVDLTGWQLDDGIGGSKPFIIPSKTIIQPGQYLAFYHSVTKLTLNDSGDSARLIDPSGNVESEKSYINAIRGQSYSFFSDGWSWTSILTPGIANQRESVSVSTLENFHDLTIQEARTEKDGTSITVTGIVTVLPGQLSTQYFYIQDETSGIQIYSYHKDFPELNVGDRVQITGTLSEVSGERRIKINSATDIALISKSAPIDPETVPISQIGENLEGRYVKIDGNITSTSGSTFYVSDGNNQIKIQIDSDTKIKKPKMKKGDSVEISGIVSQYKESYRILPIKQSDVTILTSTNLPMAGPNEGIYLVSGSVIYILCELFQKAKKRLLHLVRN